MERALPHRNPDEPHPLVKKAKVASLGLEMGISVLLGWGAGYLLDGYFGTKPWLMVNCLLLGVAAGFKSLFVTAREASRELKESNG